MTVATIYILKLRFTKWGRISLCVIKYTSKENAIDHFTAAHMETNSLLIPREPFHGVINDAEDQIKMICWL